MPALNLESLKALVGRFKRGPSDIVALDIATTGIKAVRMRGSDEGVSVLAAAILPPVHLPHTAEEAAQEIAPLDLPRDLVGRYACLTVSGEKAVVKLLTFPGHGPEAETGIEQKIVDSLGIEKPDDFRIGYKMIPTQAREVRALAVAVPNAEAAGACRLFPVGVPAPHSIELSGLAAVTAFLQGPGKDSSDEALGMVECGARVTFFSAFRKGVPLLIRKFDFGSDLILTKVQESLGVDRGTAEGILSDGSFDVSQQIGEVMDGFVKQIIVSRDFVERRENCRLGKVFASGGITASRDWAVEMKSALGFEVEAWNPFVGLNVSDGALPENLKGQESRFAAAIGAGLATLVEDA